MRDTRGFTLIEVLVALVIVGLALPALLLRIQGILDHASYMNEKTYAFWFAENKMQELLIDHKLKGDVIKKRKQQDTEEYAGRKWYWQAIVEQTAMEQMQRIEVSVGTDKDEYLATISGFLYGENDTQ